jgi:hypothetical protein
MIHQYLALAFWAGIITWGGGHLFNRYLKWEKHRRER